MLVHPDLDNWISFDRTGEPQKLGHWDFTARLGHGAGILRLAVVRPHSQIFESNTPAFPKRHARFGDPAQELRVVFEPSPTLRRNCGWLAPQALDATLADPRRRVSVMDFQSTLLPFMDG
jgi:hypothetical protein